jgi:hypothetical protein
MQGTKPWETQKRLIQIGTSVLELAKFNEARQNSFEEIMLIEISMTTKIKPEMEISIFKERFFPNTTVDLKNKDLNNKPVSEELAEIKHLLKVLIKGQQATHSHL